MSARAAMGELTPWVDPIQITSMELLFESRTEITGTSGKVYFFQRKPEIHPEPLLPLDSFVDGAGMSLYGTILRDGGIYRMWYQAWPRDWNGHNCDLVGYAESDDGLAWRKPKLGLVDYAGRNNNLVDLSGHPPTVFIDPLAPSSHRYRATLCTGPTHQGARDGLADYGYYTAHSADGLKWEYDQRTPQWNGADVITSIYHPGQRRGIVALKHMPRVNGLPRRSIWNADLEDGQWSEAHTALIPDEYDDIAAVARGFVSGDYYGMGMMAAGSGTVGFVWQFRHSLPRTAGSNIGVFGAVDVTLAYQAAHGERWLHVPSRPDFLCHTEPPWGHGGVYTASCPVEVGDEHWLYFSASARTHGWYVNEKWQIDEDLKQILIDGGISRIGLARWPKWRLFGFRSDPAGSLSLRLDGIRQPSSLLLNYECEPGGSVRVSLKGVAGRTQEEAVPLTHSSLGAPAVWADGDVLEPGADGQSIKATLHLDRASVYAYQIQAAG